MSNSAPPPTSPTPASSSPIIPPLPLSPTTPNSEDSISDDELSTTDETLGGSWILPVEDDFSSPPGSSVLGSADGSVLDLDSDNSEDEDSVDGVSHDLITPNLPPVFSHLAHHPTPPSLLDSYLDGEATESSYFGSDGTIKSNQCSIQLILPDPNGSFSITPKGSVQDVKQSVKSDIGQSFRVDDPKDGELQYGQQGFTKSGRGGHNTTTFNVRSGRIDPTWLRDSRFYASVRDETEVEQSVESEQPLVNNVDAEAKTEKEKSKAWYKTFGRARGAHAKEESEIVSRVNRLRDLRNRKKTDLKDMPSWSIRVALATLISIALVGTIGPGFNVSLLKGKRSPPAVLPKPPISAPNPIVEIGKTISIWDRLSLSPLAITSTVSEPVIKPTSIADLQLIRQALSILSTDNQGTPNVPEPSITKIKSRPLTTDPSTALVETALTIRKRTRRAAGSNSSSCCSVAIRDTDTQLAIARQSPSQELVGDIVKKWSRKALRLSNHSTSSPLPKITAVGTPCKCSLGQQFRSGLSEHFANLTLTSVIGLAGSQVAKLVAHWSWVLQEEYEELRNLTKVVYGTAQSFSRSSIERAAVGMGIVQSAWTDFKNYTSIDTALQNSQFNLEAATNSTRVHLWGSLLQARRGLDRLVNEYQSYTMGIKSDLSRTTPLPPKALKAEGRKPFGMIFRSRQNGEKGAVISKEGKWREDRRHPYKGRWGRKARELVPQEGKNMVKETKKAKRSKRERLLDMINHGAVQLIR